MPKGEQKQDKSNKPKLTTAGLSFWPYFSSTPPG
jgi:hypothetical protein